jgi:hypothetical protein
MFATTTTPPPVQLPHAVHESSEPENIGIIRLLRRVKRRLFLEMVVDDQSVQALEEGAPKPPKTPVMLAPQEFLKIPLVGRKKPIRPPVASPVQKAFSLDGMFAASTTTPTPTPPPVQLLHAVQHESSEPENMNTIILLRGVKRRLLLEMAADAQSAQALEEDAPKAPDIPVKLAPQDFKKMSPVGRMKPPVHGACHSPAFTSSSGLRIDSFIQCTTIHTHVLSVFP